MLSFALASFGVAPSYGQDVSPNLRYPARIAAGKAIFANTCALPACHGSGGAGGSAPILRGRTWTPRRLWRVVHDTSGVTFMPKFGVKLTDDEIWAVIAYVMSISARPPP